MIRAITSIEVQNPDLSHQIGQTLLSPISTLFGKSYRVEKGVHELPDDSLLKRVTVAALAVILFPLTFIAGLVGSCFLQFSATHKEAYDEIEGVPVSIVWNDDRPEIRTKQLLIRPIQEEDFPQLIRCLDIPEADQQLARNDFHVGLDMWRQTSFSILTVVGLESNRIIGLLNLIPNEYQEQEHGTAQMVFVVKPDQLNSDFSEGSQGDKAIKTEVARAGIAYAKKLRERNPFIPCPRLQIRNFRQEVVGRVDLPFRELIGREERANVVAHQILENLFVHENRGTMRALNDRTACFTINLGAVQE